MYNKSMEEDNALQNNINKNAPQGASESVVQQPVTESVSVGVSESEKKRRKWWIVAGCLIGVIAIVVVVLVLVLSSGGGVSMDKVRGYCEKNGMTVDSGTNEEPKMEYLVCQGDGGVASYIAFAVYEQPVMESERFEENYEFMKSVGVVLEESDEYKKIYLGGSENGVSYLVIGDKTYMTIIAKDNEVAKKVLTELGYPDRNWGTEDELKATSAALQSSQRDTQRRNDMARVVTALTQYQANNRGQLPKGPSYWEGEAYLGCTNGNVACGFVQSYLNETDDGTTNEFVDPLGEPYGMYITGNWVDDGSIDTGFEGVSTGLVAEGEGYTVDGEDGVIYVVKGGRCDGSKAVKDNSSRNFALLYWLEGGEVYCVDNS